MEERTEERATKLVAAFLRRTLSFEEEAAIFLAAPFVQGCWEVRGSCQDKWGNMCTHTLKWWLTQVASLLLLLQLLQLQNNFEPRGVRLLLEVGIEAGGELFGSMGWGEPAFSDMGRRHEGEGWIRPLCLIGGCDRLFVRLILVENNRENTSGPWGAKAKGRQDVLLITSLSSQTSLYLDYAVALLETRHSLGAF